MSKLKISNLTKTNQLCLKLSVALFALSPIVGFSTGDGQDGDRTQLILDEAKTDTTTCSATSGADTD